MGLKNKVVPALVLALGLVVTWEGYKTKVYTDAIGVPTVCYGHVLPKHAKLGAVFSNEACHEILQADLKIASDAVDKYVRVQITPYQKAAFVSFVYNVGIDNFRKSTLLKLINSNRIADACHELPRWVYAKGKRLQGLVNRRHAEMELCLGNI